MANGDLIDTIKAKSVARSASGYKLLDGQAATTSGVWVDTRLFSSGSVEISGTFVGTVEIHATNLPSPLSSDNGTVIGTTSSPGFVALVQSGISVRSRYVKAKVTAYTSGSINANYHGMSG
jgi:hypothetical protein